MAAFKDILHDRETRWKRRVFLSAHYHLPVATLTLNIPGPNKHLAGSAHAFILLAQLWHERLLADALEVVHSERHEGADGSALHLVVRGGARELKRCCIGLENTAPLGRLADADVLDCQGNPLSREQEGFAPRSCLLCGQRAALCIREGRHSQGELLQHILKILKLATPPSVLYQ